MQNFSSLALKLRQEIEDDGRTYCKNAKDFTTPKGQMDKNCITVCMLGYKGLKGISEN